MSYKIVMLILLIIAIIMVGLIVFLKKIECFKQDYFIFY